jgi:hypothetical protein
MKTKVKREEELLMSQYLLNLELYNRKMEREMTPKRIFLYHDLKSIVKLIDIILIFIHA